MVKKVDGKDLYFMKKYGRKWRKIIPETIKTLEHRKDYYATQH